jgi:hypothetical protein
MPLRSLCKLWTPTPAMPPQRSRASCVGTAVARCSSSRPSCAARRFAHHRRTHHECHRLSIPARPLAFCVRRRFEMALPCRRDRDVACSPPHRTTRPFGANAAPLSELTGRLIGGGAIASPSAGAQIPIGSSPSSTTAPHAAVSSLEACPTPALTPRARVNSFARAGVGQPLTLCDGRANVADRPEAAVRRRR